MKLHKKHPVVLSSIGKVASNASVPVEDVLREIQTTIDTAWALSDPTVIALQKEYFPKGKPSPEEFIAAIANREMDSRTIIPAQNLILRKKDPDAI